ncbi:DUF4233 domain-containing protein [Corynebacterium glyciniphilum]|uniref:DUF4233 domain-containing protein n=1 Tax=Corynebacterium glyciniphilum TaxID=1404244 RepID=UPI002651F3FC|nr:DUF4233 domain-containing protein [Corynebacterium glyciniphilum]MDN5682262.1 DUF4233 domain-containing protein [Corynebacterium glyciniphilum]MDN6704647.1 DUF4233 domain-containing protein [Corynebacterium glyciniphilum]
MSDNTTPLGPAHEMQVDPFKGLKGMMAGIMLMEAITVLLVLAVVGVVDDGAHATVFNMTYVAALGVAMVVASFLQFRPWADKMNIGLQVLAVLGVIVHPTMLFVAILFILAWWYTYHLRANVKSRMDRGLLPAQHYYVEEDRD